MASEDKPVDPNYRYWAFISYSQRDAAWAQRLHSRLEGYRVPRPLIGRHAGDHLVPRRLIPVFRDRSELASASDLAHEIREALQLSNSLIVICSPHAAASRWVNEEIRTFKALGRRERVFPLIVDGEPNASDRLDGTALECFPPSLRFDSQPDGTRTTAAAEPIAADARAGKDGWKDACLKLVAGILQVRFDELKRRERTRQRQRRLSLALAACAAVLALAVGYLGLADADFAVLGGAYVQRQLDRCGCSVFRPIPTRPQLQQAAHLVRDHMRRDLVAAVANGRVLQSEGRSVWEIAQISAAVFRDPNASAADFQVIVPMIDRVFGDSQYYLWDGKRVGWHDLEFHPRAEVVLWMLMTLSAALQRPDALDAAQRGRFLTYLETAQEIAEAYSAQNGRSWSMFPVGWEGQPYVFTSAIALHALLQLQSGGHCWRGDCGSLNKMIEQGAAWLTEAFVDKAGLAGWSRTRDDELPPVSDLNILLFGVLMRAHSDLRIPLTDRITTTAIAQLTNLRHRPYHPSYQEISNASWFVNSQGQRQRAVLTVRVMWYPWAVDALVNWLRYAEQAGLPVETKRALERSLGHVLVGLQRAVMEDMTNAPKWFEAETAYGLGAFR